MLFIKSPSPPLFLKMIYFCDLTSWYKIIFFHGGVKFHMNNIFTLKTHTEFTSFSSPQCWRPGCFLFCVWIGVTLHSSSSSSLPDLHIYPPHISGSQSSAGTATQASQTCSHDCVSFPAVAFHLSLPGFPRLNALSSCLWTRPLFFLASRTPLWLPSFTLPFYNCLAPLPECSQQFI